MSVLVVVLLDTVTAHLVGAQPALSADEVPAFQLRARRLTAVGEAPVRGKLAFRFDVSRTTMSTAGEAWSDWLTFDRPEIEETLSRYPARYLRAFPVAILLRLDGVADPSRQDAAVPVEPVEAELRFNENGQRFPLRRELFGPTLGLLVWRDESRKPQAATMADYNRRYWKLLEGAQIPAAQRPGRFLLVDRFIGGDDDRLNWREGIEQLAGAGMSALMLPASRSIRELLQQAGLRRTGCAVHHPPGYAFEFGEPRTAAATAAEIEAWATQQAQPYLEAGYAREEMALFAMSDEPGWYYPEMLRHLIRDSAALARYRSYLKAQRLLPAKVGASRWEEVLPIGHSQAKDLPNWTGAPLSRVSLTVRLAFSVRKVESMRRGPLPFRPVDEGVAFSLPLGAADIVALRP